MDDSVDEDRARDVAVLRLDLRVTEAISTPIRPAGLNVPDCPAAFNRGVLVGYGRRNRVEAEGLSGERNFAESDGWERETWGGGVQTYENHWPFGINYRGNLIGDSGGPLLEPTRSRVCGVASVMEDNVLDVIGVMAALDSADNKAFLRDILLDKDGNFIGERPGPDRDGDGVADAEDNCPDAPNGEQRDTDRDGVGDRCDNCVFQRNPEQRDADRANQNFEQERKLRGDPPQNPPSDGFIEANWPGDACDPHPVTVQATKGTEGGRFAPAVTANTRSIICQKHSGMFCGPATVTLGTCQLSQGNLLIANEFVGNSATPGSDATTAKRGVTRALACKCEDGTSDADCSTVRCPRTTVDAPAGTWRRMSLADPAQPGIVLRNFTTTPIGATTPFLPSFHPVIGSPGQNVHSENWGWAYWRDLLMPTELPPAMATPDPADLSNTFKSKPKVIFDGFTWTWVQSFVNDGGAAPGLSTSPTGTPNAQSLRQHVSRIVVSEQGNFDQVDPPCEQLKFLRVFDKNDCLVCQGGTFLGASLTNPVNPNPTLVAPDRYSYSAPTFASSFLLDAMRNSEMEIIQASDGRPWSTGLVRAALISRLGQVQVRLGTRDDGSIFPLLRGGGLGDTFATSSALRASGPRPAFLVALSGKRQEIAFIDRTPDGAAVEQRLRIFDFDLGTESSRAFLGKRRLVDPIAITYRAEDDAYYILDRTGATVPTVTLYRLPRGTTLEVVATWRRPGNLAETAITTGTDGTLVMTSWNDKKHAVVVIDPDALYQDSSNNPPAERHVRVLSKQFGKGAVVIPAHRNLDAITLVISDATGRPLPVRLDPSNDSKDAGNNDGLADAF